MIALAIAAAIHVAAVHVGEPPQLDGRLDDAARTAAAGFTAFVHKTPDAGMAASEPTSVRILYDADALWVGVDCVQQHAPIIRRLTRRDRRRDHWSRRSGATADQTL